ncbi:hypothetical protein K2X05_14090 [bacterium]|nr:hypothetical protein [bacterium]
MKTIIFCNLFLMSSFVFAEREQRLAVGQGIAAPLAQTSVNFSNGFTYSNSAVAGKMKSAQLTLEGDFGEDGSGNDQSGLGGELSLGNGQAGIGLGYYKNNCDGCDGRVGGIAGLQFSTMAIGVGFREDDQYSAGLLLNPNGSHRFGVTVDMLRSDLADVLSYGAGYAFHGQGFVFALDASKQETEVAGDNTDMIRITPGLEVHADKWGLSVSYDTAVNDSATPYDDNVWFGIGYRGQNFEIMGYHDYVNEWSLAVSFLF